PRRGGLTFTEWTLYARFAPRSTVAYRPPVDALKPEPRRSDYWAQLYRDWRPGHYTAQGEWERTSVPPPATLTADPVQLAVAGGEPGRAALGLYWPAVVMGTLAFAALFHLMGALFRRPAVIAILYSFFLETVMGNLPGHLKRGSISFYMRCLMYDEASVFRLSPDRPLLYEPVSGPVAW